jgi:hypothetical protein
MVGLLSLVAFLIFQPEGVNVIYLQVFPFTFRQGGLIQKGSKTKILLLVTV